MDFIQRKSNRDHPGLSGHVAFCHLHVAAVCLTTGSLSRGTGLQRGKDIGMGMAFTLVSLPVVGGHDLVTETVSYFLSG